MSHFDCIGLSSPRITLPAMLDHARLDPNPNHRLWTDPSGAAIAYHLEDDSVACATPFFVSPDPTIWRIGRAIPAIDDGCVHCSGADCDLVDASGELITRATVQLVQFGPCVSFLREAQGFPLEVVGFAHSTMFCAPEDFATESAKVMSALKLSDIAFIPVGMFGPVSPVGDRAIAIFAGRVEAVRACRNTQGTGFVHVRIRTLPGAIDVVTSDAAPEVGQQALVEAWLVGRPLLPGSG